MPSDLSSSGEAPGCGSEMGYQRIYQIPGSLPTATTHSCKRGSSIQNLTDAGLALRTALNDFVQTTDVSSHPRRWASLREVTSVIQEGLKHSPRNNSMKKLENLTREMCRLLLVQDLFHS